ncbi:YbjN domain-containing protein [Bradyrhizobium sp. sGM-13]|uniref:YbjN domain-containing protein n=1 Tax=Bradyrhizobium sp. sGM-13 TaxID=2831781 RepID=UPI001BCB0B95|nr:YbjN domain-containing protein [Bradyrhizobium sp. sGM-13]
MSDVSITKLTLDGLRESLQQVGYRVETATDPVAGLPYLRSATGGLAFDIRPGNQLSDADGSFVDAAFTAILQVQGELPLDLVNRWNATRRFGRLQLSQPFLVFCLDVSVAGGVMPDYLRAQIEIWDRLVQELIAYLRDELRQLSAKNGSASSPVSQTPGHQSATEVDAPTTVQ